MKKFKKLTAAVLAMAILITSMPRVDGANQNPESGNMRQSTELSGLNDMEIGGTDTFGNMLADELSAKSAEQEENNGYNIFSVEVEGTTAKVSFETLRDCALLVAIYDNDNAEMAASGYTEVTMEDTDAEVEINADILPEYFYIRAYLINSETFRPLSVEYTSPMYTREMQEFLSKTVDDFDSDRVINFDEKEDTNFGVFEDGITIIPEINGKNTIISANDETLTYVFGNVDEKITSLKAGDIFAYEYQDNLLIVKVKTVSVSGITATVIGQDVELEEVFEHLRIDGEVNSDKAEIDDSNMDEGVTCGGLIDDAEEDGISPQALDVTGKSSKSINFNITEKKVGSFEFSTDFNVKLGTSVKVYLSFSEIYVEFKLDLTAKLSLEFEVSTTIKMLEKKMRLAYIAIYICPGVYFSVTPEFVLELSGKASVEGTLSATVGFKVSKSGIENLSSAPKFEAKGGIEVTIFIGFLLKPALSVVHEKVFNLSLDSKAGVEITAKVEASTENIDPTCIHECDICIDGEIKGKFSIDITIKLLDSERLKFKLSLLEVSVHLWDFYISPSFGEFAFTKCPHYKYQTFLTVKNSDLDYISDAAIVIDNDKEYITNDKGKVEVWLAKGKHITEIKATDYITKTSDLNIKEGGKRFTVTIKKVGEKSASDLLRDILDKFKSGSSNPNDVDYNLWSVKPQVSLGVNSSAAITFDGSLYTWGYNYGGVLGDGTQTPKYVPTKIMDNVSSVSIHQFHSAAITFDGSLYLWGINDNGCIGYGKYERVWVLPMKIMGNVSSVSLSSYRSAAITTDGSLYLWGDNFFSPIGGTTNVPTKIMDNVSSVSLGEDHYAAITTDGSLYMWGRNNYGQLGDGTYEINKVPTKIMDNVSSVSLGAYHSAAITTDGSLYMWGSQSDGQIGDGVIRTSAGQNIPTKIMDNVSSVSLGNCYSAAITDDGSLYLWGDGSYGKLGNGTTEYSSVPVKIIFPTGGEASNFNSVNISASYTSTPLVINSLLPNEIYNIYSVNSRTVYKELSPDNLLYIGQAVSDSSGTLTIPSAAQKGTVFVKAMHEFDVYNAPITSTEVNNTSVSLTWEQIENADEYEVNCYTKDGLYSKTKASSNSITISGLEKGKYYGFLVTSTVHSEQSVPAINDVKMVYIPDVILGELNGDGKITTVDAKWVLQAVSGSRTLTPEQMAAADVNGDGKITTVDAKWILQAVSGSRKLG